jgi:hypothetical protein
MLTRLVNIAVFAAFWPRVRHTLLSNAVFKPVCWDRQLDMWRYGWQKRQDRGKNGKGRGMILTDSDTIWRAQCAVARRGWAGMAGIHLNMRLSKVLAAPGGGALIEQKYHREARLSRGWP